MSRPAVSIMRGRRSLSRALERFDRALRWLALAGGMVLVAMVLLTVVDVTLRKLWNAPIFGAQNISELALLVVVFCAVAHCGREKGHISVNLLGDALGARFTRVADTLVNLIGAAIFALLTWRALVAALQAIEIERVSNLLAIPHWPFYAMIALGAGLYAIVQLIEAIGAASGGKLGRESGN